MKNKRENGEVVVEATIIVTLTFIVISIMLYIGMVLYQQTAISVVANRTATNIAQVYSNTLKDPFTGYVDPDKAYQPITYSNMKTDAYLDVVKQKGTAFTQYRLKSSQIIPAVDRDVDVQVVNKPNEILKAQVVVNIIDTYDVPLIGFFGVDGEISFSASGRADCCDLLEYLNGVKAIANPEISVVPSLPESDTCVVTFLKDKYSAGFHAAVPVLRGKSIITSNRHSHSVMPGNPQYKSMEFTGWVTENGAAFSASTQVNDNITVYGTWQCTITFDPTGGTVDPTTKKVAYRTTTTFPTPERSGYAFEGWYTQKGGRGTEYISGVTEIPGNITLYADWRCIHPNFDAEQIESGTCQTPSKWRYKCKTCPYTEERYGDYGVCEPDSYSVSVQPSCTSTGLKIASCKYCGGSMLSTETTVDALGHKYASNGQDFDTPYSRAATCTREGIQGSRCSRCGEEKGTIIEKIPHIFNARCGVPHELGADSYKMKGTHGAGKGNEPSAITVVAECVVCRNCGEFWDGKPAVNGIEYPGRIMRNGIWVSIGMYCREHEVNGKRYTDTEYAARYESRKVYEGVHN